MTPDSATNIANLMAPLGPLTKQQTNGNQFNTPSTEEKTRKVAQDFEATLLNTLTQRAPDAKAIVFAFYRMHDSATQEGHLPLCNADEEALAKQWGVDRYLARSKDSFDLASQSDVLSWVHKVGTLEG